MVIDPVPCLWRCSVSGTDRTDRTDRTDICDSADRATTGQRRGCAGGATEQYDVGKALYVSKKCASCHGDHGDGNPKNPAVIGAAALPAKAPAGARLRASVTFATAKDVLDFVRTKMPIKEPGTLTDEEAAAVTSWMLAESKIDFAVKLEASTAGAIKLR